MSDTQKTLSAVPEDDKNNMLEQQEEDSPAKARDNGHDGGGEERDGNASGETDDQAPAIPSVLPVLPLRDSVVFNSMIVPLFEGREKAMDTVEFALNGNRYLLLCTQREGSTDEPGPEDLYSVGSVVMILRMIKMNDGQVKLLVQGLTRAHVEEFDSDGPILLARVRLLEETQSEVSDVELEAMLRSAREQSDRILHLRGLPSGEIMNVLNSVHEPGRLADIIAANMRLRIEEAQALLECLDPVERLRRVNEHLLREVEVATMQARIQSMAREGMDKAQRDYFLREQLKAIHKELGDGGDEEDENEALKKALDKAGLPPEARREADKQLRRLASMHGDSAEATVVRTYLDLLAELPWKKMSRDRLDIVKAAAILDEDHFGLEKVKDRILEFLSVRKLNPDSKGPVLCFVGPPGVGKTSLGRSIARALGRKFQRISLGGMRDEAEIRGHRRTYIGAMPGRIIQAIRQAGTRNPVIVLDEIDKLGNDFRGDPSSALLETLDPEQNSHFSDHYLNLEFDLSKVLFLCTANQLDTIPPALLDRLEIISLSGYTEQEKLSIARSYLIRRQVAENGRVDISYFNDAIFMGDSLADGFRVYSGSGSLDLRNTAATYITRQSLTPRSFTQPGAMIDVGDGPIDPWATVEQKNPGKVYVTLGTNALMSMDPQEFIDSYYVFIDMLKEKAPNAVIYVTTITPTTGWKAREEPRLSFDRIYQANQLIAKMCNEKGLALINLYDVLKSDSGYLREEIARSDGYHLTPTGYQEWLDYLITHTVYNPSSPYIPGSPYARTI